MTAEVLKHSISPSGIQIITMRLKYPRYILAEFNTHRMFSRNTASSRAIPIESMIETVQNDPAMPIYWGSKNKGMTSVGEIKDIETAKSLWLEARDLAIERVKKLNEIGLHKQLANRLLEPWSWSETVVTSTEWANFFHLRNHKDAQPRFKFLAEEILKATQESSPVNLNYGEWHLPYVQALRNELGKLIYLDNDGQEISLEDARIISASCCAQVSYRSLDTSLDKAKRIYSKLIESDPAHASPVEHQATPINLEAPDKMLESSGITHMTRDMMLWSGNFRGWIQFRKLIPNETHY